MSLGVGTSKISWKFYMRITNVILLFYRYQHSEYRTPASYKSEGLNLSMSLHWGYVVNSNALNTFPVSQYDY